MIDNLFVSIALLALFRVGCNVDVNTNVSAEVLAMSTTPMGRDASADDDTPTEDRVDRRGERRENLRETVDNVDAPKPQATMPFIPSRSTLIACSSKSANCWRQVRQHENR